MVPGLELFLRRYPKVTLLPIVGRETLLEGEFQFFATAANHPEISDAYRLRIAVPEDFPSALPVVVELDHKIPRNGDFHVNPDGSLCLGSPLRLLLKLSKEPSLPGYASHCLVPYLYAISHKLRFGGKLPFHELAHGRPGEIQDYVELLGLQRPEQAERAIKLLGLKKRIANKAHCPCGCGRRVGKCAFNKKLGKMRRLASRSWFRAQSSLH
jgi:hypothetical protein